jgi:hypothetical protein
MSLPRYWFGIPVRTITAGAQRADFDEELSGLGDGGSLMMRADGFDYHAGPDIISGMGPRGEFRPRRFVFQVDIGTGVVAAANHALTRIICEQDGTRVTLTFGGISITGTAFIIALQNGFLLPSVICPSATATGFTSVTGSCNVTTAGTETLGAVQITAAGAFNISMGPIGTAFAAAATIVHPFSITYDTGRHW